MGGESGTFYAYVFINSRGRGAQTGAGGAEPPHFNYCALHNNYICRVPYRILTYVVATDPTETDYFGLKMGLMSLESKNVKVAMSSRELVGLRCRGVGNLAHELQITLLTWIIGLLYFH